MKCLMGSSRPLSDMVSTVIEQIEQLRTDYIYHYVIIGNAKQHVV